MDDRTDQQITNDLLCETNRLLQQILDAGARHYESSIEFAKRNAAINEQVYRDFCEQQLQRRIKMFDGENKQ